MSTPGGYILADTQTLIDAARAMAGTDDHDAARSPLAALADSDNTHLNALYQAVTDAKAVTDPAVMVPAIDRLTREGTPEGIGAALHLIATLKASMLAVRDDTDPAPYRGDLKETLEDSTRGPLKDSTIATIGAALDFRDLGMPTSVISSDPEIIAAATHIGVPTPTSSTRRIRTTPPRPAQDTSRRPHLSR